MGYSCSIQNPYLGTLGTSAQTKGKALLQGYRGLFLALNRWQALFAK